MLWSMSPSPQPPGLTIVTGTQAFLVGQAIADAVAAARGVDPEVDRRDVGAGDPGAAGQLLTALSPSLFGEAAVVVVLALGEAPDDVVDVLTSALADLPERTWVVAVHAGSRGRALDRVRACQVRSGVAEVTCADIKKGRPTRDFLDARARQAGRRITADAVEALVLALGSDIALLVGALEQLLADVPQDPIDAPAVAATFAGVAEVTGFQVADAVWEARAVPALQRLRWGLSTQTLTGASAVGSLAAGLRALVRVAGAPRGMAKEDVARTAGVPPFKVGSLRAALANWEPAQLGRAVCDLAAVDAQVKGGLRPGESLEAAQKERALEAFIIATVGLRERSPAPHGRGRTAVPRGDLAGAGDVPVS